MFKKLFLVAFLLCVQPEKFAAFCEAFYFSNYVSINNYHTH